jgi:hypothetical protein
MSHVFSPEMKRSSAAAPESIRSTAGLTVLKKSAGSSPFKAAIMTSWRPQCHRFLAVFCPAEMPRIAVPERSKKGSQALAAADRIGR